MVHLVGVVRYLRVLVEIWLLAPWKRGPGVVRLLWPPLCALAAAAAIVGCSPGSEPERLLVFAATSLINAIEEIRPAFQEKEGIELAVSYGGSQMLAQQIVQGAPADLFISAGEGPVGLLAGRDLTDGGARSLLSNDLVVVSRMRGLRWSPSRTWPPVSSGGSPSRIRTSRRPARTPGSPSSIWACGESLADKLVLSPNVRVALAYVEAGNADAALVYRTDAMASSGLRVLDIVPADTYSTIVYPAVLIRGSGGRERAELFLDHLQTPSVREVFARYGFLPPPSEAGNSANHR